MATNTTNGNEDILWSAGIEDHSSEYFDNFMKQIEATRAKVDSEFQKIDKSIEDSGQNIGVVSGLIGGLTVALTNMAMQGASAIKQFVQGSIDLRARIDTLGVSLNLVGANAGYSKEEMAGFEQGLIKTGITTQSARTSLLQMAQANLDLSKSSELARVAQDAAVIAGINSSDAYSRILHGITTMQPEILRGMGIIVNMQAEYSKVAATTGRTTEQIGMAERQQIALNATLKAAQNIAGTYEAAMGSVGKMLTSLPRYYEEIQQAIGAVFQPAYFELIKEWTNLLKEVKKYIDENKDSIEAFGKVLGDILGQIVLPLFRELVKLVVQLPGLIEDAGIELAKFFGQLAGPEYVQQIEKMRGNLWETFVQTFILAKATLSGLLALIDNSLPKKEDVGMSIVNGVAGAIIPGYGSLVEVSKQMRGEKTQLKQDPGKAYQDAYNESIKESIKTLEDYKKASEDAGKATEDLGNYAKIQAGKLTEAIAMANVQLTNLKKTLEEESAQRSLKAQREEITREIQLAWQREDMARKNAEAITEITKNAEENKKKLVENSNKSRVKMEEDYRKRLEEIQNQFEFDASELARKRDAVGLMALIRQTRRQLEQEKKSYAERKKEFNDNYNETIAEMEKNTKEQLKRLEESRKKEEENLARSLERQQIMRSMQEQWEIKDRQKAQDKQLEDMVKQFATMDGMTKEGLAGLLRQWSGYYSNLGAIINGYYASLGQYGLGQSAFSEGDGERLRDLYKYRKEQQATQNTGAAGLVSSMLTPAGMGNVPVSRVPAANASKSVDRREIVLKVEGNALDPYMQRVALRTLYEIERNSG